MGPCSKANKNGGEQKTHKKFALKSEVCFSFFTQPHGLKNKARSVTIVSIKVSFQDIKFKNFVLLSCEHCNYSKSKEYVF